MKKLVIGSLFVVLLMLVTSQFGFVQTARSWPTSAHPGNASAGSLWVSEMDVSSKLRTIDHVGIAHAAATDDWVYWSNKRGYIDASWSINLGRSHPEYFIEYTLRVFRIDSTATELASTTAQGTYLADTGYSTAGSLSIFLSFTDTNPVKLVCYLDAWVKVNGSESTQAYNFSSLADDRSVVVVQFSEVSMLNFPLMVHATNLVSPPMWSWMNDWENHFASEDSMFNDQTYATVGNSQGEPSGGNGMWDFGDLSIILHTSYMDASFTPGSMSVNWSYNVGGGHWVKGPTKIDYSITPRPRLNPPIIMRYFYMLTETTPHWPAVYAQKRWTYGLTPNTGSIYGTLYAEDIYDANNDSQIHGTFYLWARAAFDYYPYSNANYYIHIVPNGGNTAPSGGSTTYWEADTAYETSESISVSHVTYLGITTVSMDIGNILGTDNEFVYTYAGDVGTNIVQFTCS